jgi:hypothetical protein
MESTNEKSANNNNRPHDASENSPSSSQNPSTNLPVGSTPNSAQRTSNEAKNKARDDAFKSIPYIGPWLVWMLYECGLKGIMLFLTGALILAGLVFFGALPNWMVSDKYKSQTPANKISSADNDKKRNLPRGVFSVNTVSDDEIEKRDWLKRSVDLMEIEATRQTRGNEKIVSGAKAVEHVIDNPTAPFSWTLDARNGYSLGAGRAYRITKNKETNDELIQPLNFQTSGSTITFTIPACEEGDVLMAVMWASWGNNQQTDDITAVFDSKAR